MALMRVKKEDGTIVALPLGVVKNNTNCADGRSIVSINKTGQITSDGGMVIDTYTITYTDNSTSEFTVTNGKDGADGNGIVNINKTNTVVDEITGRVTDIYTIYYTNGNTDTFTIINGIDAAVDENALNEMLVDKCGDIQSYGEFVTALRSEKVDPGFIDLGPIDEINNVVHENGVKGASAKDLAFEVTFRVDETSTQGNAAIFGARRTGSELNYSVYHRRDLNRLAAMFAYVEGNRHPTQMLNFKYGEIYTVRYDATGASFLLNGEPVASSEIIEPYTEVVANSNFPFEKNLYLFAINHTGAVNSSNPFGSPHAEDTGGTKAIYDFKIYVSGELIRHYKPYINSRGVSCMKDVVNNVEYPATVGTLIAEI